MSQRKNYMNIYLFFTKNSHFNVGRKIEKKIYIKIGRKPYYKLNQTRLSSLKYSFFEIRKGEIIRQMLWQLSNN